MASTLKRKGAPSEVLDAPKRVKTGSETKQEALKKSGVHSIPATQEQAPALDLSKFGWDAAFGGPVYSKEIVLVNGVNGSSQAEVPGLGGEEVNRENALKLKKRSTKKKSKSENENESLSEQEVISANQIVNSDWKIAESIGGRMIDLDPVFVGDERYIVVAQRKSLRVYSTSTSLLNRVIDLEVDLNSQANDRIVSFCLSTTNPNLIWVAYSTGLVFRIDWTTGAGSETSWTTSENGTTYMTVASIESAGRIREVVYTTDEKEEGGWRIQAHEFTSSDNLNPRVARTIYQSGEEIQLMTASADGAVIVASSGTRILVGQLRNADFDTIEKIRYTFRVFESSSPVCSIDLRVYPRSILAGTGKSKVNKAPVVDVVVGDARGSIFVHNDLLSNLILAETSEGQDGIHLIPRKLHWHRRAVHSVKWSRDGDYLISGGSENVLVIWQLDTGRHQFLPNLMATIQNIVISPIGASYAVRLGDNSTMILSTAELTPTANFSGLQAHVIKMSPGLDTLVRRVKEERSEHPIMEKTPALINPARPSHLLVAVGNTQEIDPVFALKSSVPYLQTFDITSSHNVSRQALTRTNVTGRVEAPNAYPIDEARITHMQISNNGKWLATIDEWIPPRRDVSFLRHEGFDIEEEQRRRREVYLKFWKWNDADSTWELVSRIDAPHTIASETFGAGQVLSLVAHPTSNAFSTFGEDSFVRTWRPRTRKRAELVVKGKDREPLVDWKCQHSISLGEPELVEDEEESIYSRPEHGCLAYSNDGSVLAAALSGTEDNVIFLIDPQDGSIRSTRSAIYDGELIDLAFLDQYLIILAEELQVYDLVTETMLHQIALGPFRTLMSLKQKIHMMHLAVDVTSHTFAVALPTSTLSPEWLKKKAKHRQFLDAANTEIAIFNPETAVPLLTHTLSAFATALLPAIGNSGYLVLDAAAEVTPILPKTVQTITSTALPIADMHLDDNDENDAIAERQLTDILDDQEAGEENEDEDEEMAEAAVDADLDDDGPKVVSQQKLASLFDGMQPFAMPPIEEMFYQVANLFSSKSVEV